MKRIIALVVTAIASALMLAPTASASYNTETVSQFVSMVNAEVAKYGTGPVSVYVDYLGTEIIAETGYDGTITLNASYAAMSPEQFNEYVADDVASGWMPGGCYGAYAVAIHEMGHIIDNRTGLLARYAVIDAANNGTIGYDMHGYAFDSYGRVNPIEAVAVSFQAAECGTATPTESAIYNALMNSPYN